MRLIAVLIVLAGLGCGKGSNPALSSGPSLFKVWVSTDDFVTLDLSKGTFSEPFQGSFYWPTQGTCVCTFTFTDTSTSREGSFVANGCVYQEGPVDPMCDTYLEGLAFSYVHENNKLTDCTAACVTYEPAGD